MSDQTAIDREMWSRLEHRDRLVPTGHGATVMCSNAEFKALMAAARARDELEKRASTLEDAAFHFQTCATCRSDYRDTCVDGQQFAAFLRGESDGD